MQNFLVKTWSYKESPEEHLPKKIPIYIMAEDILWSIALLLDDMMCSCPSINEDYALCNVRHD